MHLKLTDIIQETDDVLTFVWEPSEPLTWQAGQFLKYTLPHDNQDDRQDVRWFTISSAPFENNPHITTRFAESEGSSFKEKLRTLDVGDSIEADVPGGSFVFDSSRHAVFIAGGIGITPFRSMLLQLDHDQVDSHVRLLYANRNDQYVFRDELEGLTKKHDFQISYFTGIKIQLEDIQREAGELDNPLYYISGPKPLVETYKDQLAATGVSEDNIKTDYFPGY